MRRSKKIKVSSGWRRYSQLTESEKGSLLRQFKNQPVDAADEWKFDKLSRRWNRRPNKNPKKEYRPRRMSKFKTWEELKLLQRSHIRRTVKLRITREGDFDEFHWRWNGNLWQRMPVGKAHHLDCGDNPLTRTHAVVVVDGNRTVRKVKVLRRPTKKDYEKHTPGRNHLDYEDPWLVEWDATEDEYDDDDQDRGVTGPPKKVRQIINDADDDLYRDESAARRYLGTRLIHQAQQLIEQGMRWLVHEN